MQIPFDLVHSGAPRPWPALLRVSPAGCLVVLMGACPQRPAHPRPAAVVAPALFPLRIRLLQASWGGPPREGSLTLPVRGGRSSRLCPSIPRRASAVSEPGPHWRPLDCSSVQSAGRPREERKGPARRPGRGQCLQFSARASHPQLPPTSVTLGA